jgi:signal peptidase II
MRVLALLALLVPCVACDQATKALAIGHLKGSAGVNVVDGFFRLVYAENPGAFLGLGRGLPEGLRVSFFVVGVAALLIGAVALALSGSFHADAGKDPARAGVLALRKRPPLPVFLGLALLVAGGLGNLVDRVARDGRVVDFAILQVGPLQTGVFNVADVQIVAAAGLLFFGTWRKRKPDDNTPDEHLPVPVSTG